MRNVWILALAQALAACGTIMLVAFGGIVGTRVAPRPELATLPLSLGIVGTAFASIPAALLMRGFGRRPVFLASSLVAAAASLLFAWGVAQESFLALCIGALLLGANMAVVQQYRFAAAEFVEPARAGQAVSVVMIGTLAAAVIGPELGGRARDLGGWPEFTGSYVVLALLCILAAGVLLALGEPPAHELAPERQSRSLREIVSQPAYLVAMLAGVCSYAVMSFIMTATPLSMHVHDGLSVAATKNVISGHLLGMYLPSLASGWLVRALGIRRLMFAGLACMLACIAGNVAAVPTFESYFVTLLLLGIGWNFLFVAGTTLLTTTYAAAERFRAQGLNDFAIFGTQAIVSLLAGAAVTHLGWAGLNLASLPLIALMLAALGWLRRREPPARRSVGQPLGR